MKLKAVYETPDEIPEQFRSIYREAEGRHIVDIDGILFADDHKNLLSALDSERDARSKAEKELKRFSDIDLGHVDELKKRVPELEQALSEANESKRNSIDKAVDERLGPLRREHEAQIRALSQQAEALTGENQTLKGQIAKRTFEESIRKVATKKGIREQAVPDVIARASEFGWTVDQNGDFATKRSDGSPRYSLRRPTDPMQMDEWFDDVLAKEAPHMFAETQGGDATGSRGHSITAKPRSKMTRDEKIAYVEQHGFDKYTALPD